MMLGWVQGWALTNQNINIHQYEIDHTETQDDQAIKENLFYTCFEPLLMLGRQSTTVLNFFNAAFFVTTFIYLL